MRSMIALTEGAPAPTIVLDARHLEAGLSRDDVLAAANPLRRRWMSARPDLGPKMLVMRAVEGHEVDVEFFQGLTDGSVDVSVTVCGNSAAAAVAVARHAWGLLPAGPLALRMGGESFGYEELDA